VGVGQRAEPYIAPAWVALTDPVAQNCTTCSGPAFERNRNKGMFQYKQLCIKADPVKAQTAFISTRWGRAGSADTILYVYNNAHTVELFDDFSNLVCSDSSKPSTANCAGPCLTPDDRCQGTALLLSLSQVKAPVPAGSVPACYNVAVGADAPTVTAISVGIDVVVWPPGAPPGEAAQSFGLACRCQL
jgi:hypothetical protein